MSEASEKAQDAKNLIWRKLQGAGPGALAGTKSILAVAILYENPRGMALPGEQRLAEILVGQYRRPDWIPHSLSLDSRTPVAARELVQGQEISAHAGLDSATSNDLLAGMLAALVGERDIDNTSAIAFRGDSPVLGQTYFAVLAE